MTDYREIRSAVIYSAIVLATFFFISGNRPTIRSKTSAPHK